MIIAQAALALLFAWIMVSAGLTKLRAPDAAAATIDAYAVLPSGSGSFLAAPLGCLEIAGGFAIVLPSTRTLGALTVAALILIYTAAIILRLWRGGADIDCGCAPHTGRVPVSRGLVARNGVLFLASLVVTLPLPDSVMSAHQWLVAGVLAVLGVWTYELANALLAWMRWPADD